jgi:hypothetical protein
MLAKPEARAVRRSQATGARMPRIAKPIIARKFRDGAPWESRRDPQVVQHVAWSGLM